MAAKKNTSSRPRLKKTELDNAIVQAYKGQVMSMQAKPVADKDILKVASMTFGVIINYMRQGYAVPVPNFGKFEVHHRNARKARNPQTGKPLKVAAHESPVFTASSALKRIVNQK